MNYREYTREYHLLISIVLLNLLDSVLTVKVLSTQGAAREGNPLAAFLLERGIVWHVKALVVTCLVVAFVTAAALNKINESTYRNLGVVTTIYIAVVTLNTTNLLIRTFL